MAARYIQVLCDIDCEWDQISPKYRVFVNNELFIERTWIWRDHYLEEMLQIEANPGMYHLKFELVEPELGTLNVKNLRIRRGNGQIVNHSLEIFK